MTSSQNVSATVSLRLDEFDQLVQMNSNLCDINDNLADIAAVLKRIATALEKP